MSRKTDAAIAVVAHLSRGVQAEHLADDVGATYVAYDDGARGAGPNHVACWEWLEESNREWGVVLEDDAVPVKDFVDNLDVVLKNSPSPIVSLYLGRGRPPHWQPQIMRVMARPESFLMAPTLLHHVGVALRTSCIPLMLDYLSVCGAYQLGQLPIDEAIGGWVKKMGWQVAYCHPSIVDHRDQEPVISHRVTGYGADDPAKRDQKRVAWMFGTREWDGSSVDIPCPTL